MSLLLDATRIAIPGRLAETTLRIGAGEMVCLVGPNGSGKTSLLHAVAGIGGATGEVRISGTDPAGVAPGQRKRSLSYLPATRDLAWPLTGADLVALGLPERGDRARIGRLLEHLGLSAFAARPADQLSTGERSRLLIARALIAEPKLLLLDEPVANLDPLWQLLMMERFRAETRQPDRAALVAVHDLDLAARYADRLLVMNEGRIVADAAPADVLAGETIAEVFGIERDEAGGWRPISSKAGPRSSR